MEEIKQKKPKINNKKENIDPTRTDRPWGYYRVINDFPGMKVKELVVMSEKALSLQRHGQRSEFWMVAEGECVVNGVPGTPSKHLRKHEPLFINKGVWHQIYNPFEEPCRIVEIQYGDNCVEDDIERAPSPVPASS